MYIWSARIYRESVSTCTSYLHSPQLGDDVTGVQCTSCSHSTQLEDDVTGLNGGLQVV